MKSYRLPFLVCAALAFGAIIPLAKSKADDVRPAGSDLAGTDGPKTFDRDKAQRLMKQYCFDCHGDGAEEGDLNLDSMESIKATSDEPELWWKVLKNLRAGVMPPPGESRPSDDETMAIANWIKFGLFGVDADDPDPGRLVVRRLNRAEYGNTISALMGVRFNASLLFPADDSGHGFDNVGDALSISPMLMEKYFKAARMIVADAVPTRTWIVPLQVFQSEDFLDAEGLGGESGFNGKKHHQRHKSFELSEPGEYTLELRLRLDGSFNYDPARYQVEFRLDDEVLLTEEFGWNDNKALSFPFRLDLTASQHELSFAITPVVPDEQDDEQDSTSVRFEIAEIRVEGPAGTKSLVHPVGYERFFTRDQPPLSSEDRREYAREVLLRFTERAFRSEVNSETIQRLVAIAERTYTASGATFEAGIAEAFVAVLCSPRFLYHLEASDAQSEQRDLPHGPVSELALASRLAYFLWSSQPDDELIELAREGRLRSQITAQISRMLEDERSEALIQNFVGQWLRTRDVSSSAVDALAVLGLRQKYDELLSEYRKLRLARGLGSDRSEREEHLRDQFREIRRVSERYGRDLREAMSQETEMYVEDVVRQDRSLLDLIDSNYTFVNESLARHYGIDGVDGEQMRRVELDPDSPRGGILTQASMLLVTSNPTRTSPVKRGLFVLENILGTPAPPAPAGVPELEAAADQFEGRTPTLRELLAAHREASICSSCHARMDPLGLALENFDALGQWREKELGIPIEASGQLITGESFADIRELKQILREQHADEFYRCITEKLLTYALGRGVEYGDQHAVDLIVDRLHESEGRFTTLLEGVIQSAPFQMKRYRSSGGHQNGVD